MAKKSWKGMKKGNFRSEPPNPTPSPTFRARPIRTGCHVARSGDRPQPRRRRGTRLFPDESLGRPQHNPLGALLEPPPWALAQRWWGKFSTAKPRHREQRPPGPRLYRRLGSGGAGGWIGGTSAPGFPEIPRGAVVDPRPGAIGVNRAAGYNLGFISGQAVADRRRHRRHRRLPHGGRRLPGPACDTPGNSLPPTAWDFLAD